MIQEFTGSTINVKINRLSIGTAHVAVMNQICELFKKPLHLMT